MILLVSYIVVNEYLAQLSSTHATANQVVARHQVLEIVRGCLSMIRPHFTGMCRKNLI